MWRHIHDWGSCWPILWEQRGQLVTRMLNDADQFSWTTFMTCWDNCLCYRFSLVVYVGLYWYTHHYFITKCKHIILYYLYMIFLLKLFFWTQFLPFTWLHDFWIRPFSRNKRNWIMLNEPSQQSWSNSWKVKRFCRKKTFQRLANRFLVVRCCEIILGRTVEITSKGSKGILH